MNRKTLISTLVLLSATGLTGCVSQNAMSTLPDDVRLAVTADAVRQSMPEETSKTQQPADRETAASARLSPVELEFRRRQMEDMTTAAPLAATSADEASARPDPVEMFARARQMQLPSSLPDNAPVMTASAALDPAAAEAQAEEARATWQAALALAKAKPGDNPTPAGTTPAHQAPDASIVTAAVEEKPEPADLVEFVLDGQLVPQDVTMDLRLKAIGGRKAHRIVIGRVDGNGFEVLARAQEIARIVQQATGGEPGMSYDPAMSAGAVRVEYAPFAKQER
ncbi:MAG: hypothetical protein KDJ74_01160 [Notoacmeibacter sp.]|nr:hypothetical protein [Notoacmeibacter sp.]